MPKANGGYYAKGDHCAKIFGRGSLGAVVWLGPHATEIAFSLLPNPSICSFNIASKRLVVHER